MFDFYQYKNNKLFKIIIITLCVYISVISVTNVIIASDIDHILHCEEEGCSHCTMIHFCQIQLGVVYLSIPPMIFTLLFMKKQKIIDLINEINKNNTLVECKIQLNN